MAFRARLAGQIGFLIDGRFWRFLVIFFCHLASTVRHSAVLRVVSNTILGARSVAGLNWTLGPRPGAQNWGLLVFSGLFAIF